MKDLLADLQVADGDFSLEQLEKELATLDHQPSHLNPQPLPTLDAASLIVSHAQERSAGVNAPVPATPPTNQGMDAWSLSLQNFTAMSLQNDFLAADSARKQQQQTTVPHNIQPVALDGAEDYDIGEKPVLNPPPGLGGQANISATETPKAFPRTPQNSVLIPDDEVGELMDAMSKMAPSEDSIPPQGSPASTPADSMPAGAISIPPQQQVTPSQRVAPPYEAIPPQTEPAQGLAPPTEAIPAQNAWGQGAPPPPGAMPPQPRALQGMPHPGDIPPQQGIPAQAVPQGMTPQQMQAGPAGTSMPPQMPPQVQGQPVIVATSAMGPAWQTPRAPMPPPVRAFCNPHPAAPPIPAAALEAKFMNARDIAYVVHSILKPVLAEGVLENDYYIQFLRRRGGQQANPSGPKQPKDINAEMMSRATKTKEWSSKKGVLGRVTKANVARPRALIATPQATSDQDTEQKQRASLWKARIYCDQAYQSYQMVVDIWRSAPPGGVPPQVQLHLVKLMKCMGITLVDKEYQLDTESLSLLVKLSKGRTLVARLLEQALLPPNAVQTLLPALLDVLLASAAKKGDESKNDDISSERLFRSIAGVLQKLNTTSETLLRCLEAVQRHGKVSLSSSARMECVHTLLQKGSIVVGQDPSEEKRSAWGKAESEFMSLLQAY